jgi:hypothetical protein
MAFFDGVRDTFGVLARVPPLKTEEVTDLKADRTLKLKCLESLFYSFLLAVKKNNL